jgi:hypothetical protein
MWSAGRLTLASPARFREDAMCAEPAERHQDERQPPDRHPGEGNPTSPRRTPNATRRTSPRRTPGSISILLFQTAGCSTAPWIPAFAGMTSRGVGHAGPDAPREHTAYESAAYSVVTPANAGVHLDPGRSNNGWHSGTMDRNVPRAFAGRRSGVMGTLKDRVRSGSAAGRRGVIPHRLGAQQPVPLAPAAASTTL